MEMGKRWHLERGERREEGPEGVMCVPGAGHWGAAAECQAGCLGPGPTLGSTQICCVILGKPLNFSEFQPPHIWQKGLF